MKKYFVSTAALMLALIIIPSSAQAVKPDKNDQQGANLAQNAKKISIDIQTEDTDNVNDSGKNSAPGRIKKSEKEILKQSSKEQIKQEKLALKAERKSLYTAEEWSEGLKLQAELNKVKDLRALSLDSIIIVDKPVKFDTPPVIKSGRTLIPVRGVAASLGADVAWNAATNTVTITKGDTIIEFKIDDEMMTINGKSKKLEVPAQIVNKRTVVPLRALIESMGLGVDWDADTETIVIIDEPITENPVIEEPVTEEAITEELIIAPIVIEEPVIS